jgi:hypothetical protein
VGSEPATRPRRGLSGLLGVAYLIAEGAGEEASLLEQGMAATLLVVPFFLLIHTVRTLWPLIQGHSRGLLAVWAAGAAGLALIAFADADAGSEVTSFVLLCRLLALLGPGLLALVTVAWLFDRWSRGLR